MESLGIPLESLLPLLGPPLPRCSNGSNRTPQWHRSLLEAAASQIVGFCVCWEGGQWGWLPGISHVRTVQLSYLTDFYGHLRAQIGLTKSHTPLARTCLTCLRKWGGGGSGALRQLPAWFCSE